MEHLTINDYQNNRPYQVKSISDLIEWFNSLDKIVFAASCGAGKSLISIAFIQKFIQEYAKKSNKAEKDIRILVLTHGHDILRHQYTKYCDKEALFSFAKVNQGRQLADAYKSYQVIVTLPNSIRSVLDNRYKFDLVVIDEGHQYLFANSKKESYTGMVDKIIQTVQPKKILALTGTPAPFILRGGWKVLPIAMQTLFELGFLSNVYVQLASSSILVKMKREISEENYLSDYNNNGDLKRRKEYTELENKETLDNVLKAIYRHLRSRFRVNPENYGWLRSEKLDWILALNEIHKTMFIAKSQFHARLIEEEFTKQGIKTLLNITEPTKATKQTTKESVEIFERFKIDDTQVLIVVGRGILGFDYPDLINVVDMSCSINPNRIFQAFSRLVRLPENNKGVDKVFIKVAPRLASEVNMGGDEYFRHIMCATLSLMNEEWLTKFNGKNFWQMEILVKKHSSKTHKPRGPHEPGSFKPIVYDGLSVQDFFTDIKHEDTSEFHFYAKTSMGEIRQQYIGIKERKPEQHKQDILNWIEKNSMKDVFNFPSQYSKNLEERTLSGNFRSYTTPTSLCYDSIFVNILREKFNYLTRDERIKKNKQDIISFIKEHNRLPAEQSKDDEENRLAILTNEYIFVHCKSYNPDFRQEVERLLPLGIDRIKARIKRQKEETLDFIRKNNKLPHSKSKDAIERRLCGRMYAYIAPGGKSFDPDFRKEIEKSVSLKKKINPKEKKKQILEFIKLNKRRPSVKTEQKLYEAMHRYMSPSRITFDSDFRKEVKNLISMLSTPNFK
jgi:superfamily II DNA or RNA helicase